MQQETRPQYSADALPCSVSRRQQMTLPDTQINAKAIREHQKNNGEEINVFCLPNAPVIKGKLLLREEAKR